ncbi:hypothetical protein ACEPAF_9106 [Sanghuangporus sanghuang]
MDKPLIIINELADKGIIIVMPVIRYTNEVEVQGWEPALDGGVDASLDAVAVELPSNFGTDSTTTPSRRQVPPTRARAATCPDIHNFTFMPRQGPNASIPQNNSAMTESGAPGLSPSTSSSSSFSSSRNAAAAGRSGSRPRSSTERKIARKLAENANYVPRPKNSFILFRTEFVAQRTNGGTQNSSGSKSDTDDDDDATQSLSKQASAVWNKMTGEEKKPYVERAKLEKAAHEAKYPHYRYKPVRHNSARKNGPLPPAGRSGLSPFHGPSLSLPRENSEPLAAQAMNTNNDGSPQIMEVDGQYAAVYQSSSAVAEMSAPAPRRFSLSSSASASSSLANALESRSPTPGSTNGSGLSLSSVPPVPTLTFNMQPGPSRVSGLPPIPRSPSAPVFDRHVVRQLLQTHQHQHLVPPTLGTSRSQYPAFSNPFSAGSNFAAAARRASPSIGNVTSPVSSAAESDVAVPTPENMEPDYFHDFVRCDSDKTTAGPTSSFSPTLFTNQRLFTNNETYNEKSNDNNGDTHSSSNSNSNNISTMRITAMTTHYEMDEMDIDMRALLNLSPVPEVPELASGGNVSSVQRPFEAIAALWVQNQQLQLQAQQQQHRQPANEEDTIVSQNQSQGQEEMQTQTPVQAQVSPPKCLNDTITPYSSSVSFSQSEAPSTVATSSASASGQPEVGLDTYALAVSGTNSDSDTSINNNTSSTGTSSNSSVTGSDFDYFSSCVSSSTSTSGASRLEDDLFRLDLDFIRPTSSASASSAAARFGCALDGSSTLSGLADEDVFGSYNYNLSNGDSAIVGDMFGYGFGYDRERGLYGGLALGAGAGSIGFGYGLEYGL